MNNCSECGEGRCVYCERDAALARVAELEAENAKLRDYAAQRNGNALAAITEQRDALERQLNDSVSRDIERAYFKRIQELEAKLLEIGGYTPAPGHPDQGHVDTIREMADIARAALAQGTTPPDA